QSVEKAIKTGNIYELRNLTISILKAMKSVQGENL
ncbi:SatD family protein, partial [Fusobacterium polymorphum]